MALRELQLRFWLVNAHSKELNMRTVVIGSGSWGTALAQVLQDNHQEVLVYGVAEAEVNDINENHKNSKYFGDVELNPELKATTDIQCVKGADIVLLAVPTIAIDPICHQINDLLDKKTIIINVSKGFHPETNERMSEVIRRCIDEDKLSLNNEDAVTVQNLFSNQYLRIYTGNDEIGSELGVAIKNVMAIASGILSGLGYQDNTRAALITRGLQEMIRYGVHFGGQQKTFMGLTGIGDLIVTCTSVHSRNFEAGYQIGKENSVENFFKNNTKTVEGVRTAKIVHRVAKENGIDMPICEEVYQILFNGKLPNDCAQDLMIRDLKKEF